MTQRTDHYSVLDVASDASPSEIGSQYRALKALYNGELGTYGLLSEADREKALNEIERAYFVLCDAARRRAYDRELTFKGHEGPWYEPGRDMPGSSLSPPSNVEAPVADVGEETLVDDVQKSPEAEPAAPAQAQQPLLDLAPPEDRMDGRYLRSARELRNVSLDALSKAIKITVTQLENIEAHKFDKLPAPVYLRGFLRSYAQFVGIDPDRLVQDFLTLRDEWAQSQGPAA